MLALVQVVQVLPTDYYAQLEVAHHISCYAFSNKVGQAELTASGCISARRLSGITELS